MNLEHYTTKGKKVGDFCIGFFGFWIFTMLLSGLSFLVMQLFWNNWGYSIEMISSIAAFVIEIIAAVGSIIFFIKVNRGYITIGIISSIIIPLLITGACFGVVFGLNGLKFY